MDIPYLERLLLGGKLAEIHRIIAERRIWVAADKDQNILAASPAATKYLRCPEERMVLLRVSDFVYPDRREVHEEEFTKWWENGSPDLITDYVRGIRHDGTTFECRLGLQLVTGNSRPWAVAEIWPKDFIMQDSLPVVL